MTTSWIADDTGCHIYIFKQCVALLSLVCKQNAAVFCNPNIIVRAFPKLDSQSLQWIRADANIFLFYIFVTLFTLIVMSTTKCAFLHVFKLIYTWTNLLISFQALISRLPEGKRCGKSYVVQSKRYTIGPS